MLKSLLIGLDGSDDSRSVLELGLRWAKRFDALAVGLGIVDEPGIHTSGAALFAGGHHWHAASPTPLCSPFHATGSNRSCGNSPDAAPRPAWPAGRWRTSARPSSRSSSRRSATTSSCSASRPTSTTGGGRARRDARQGPPGQPSPGGRRAEDAPRRRVGGRRLRRQPPGGPRPLRLRGVGPGGLPGGPRRQRRLRLKDAARHADRAVEFLHPHGIEATPHPVDTSVPTAEVILRKVRYLEAGLLVMGAYGQPVLREFFLGSVTRTVLEESPVPVFCYH